MTSSVGDGAFCEEIRIPMCRDSMPYNITVLPNLLHHSTQKNAHLVIDQYTDLVKTNCSDSLLFFLCSMFTPICPVEFHKDVNLDFIPPCREVCLDAMQGCEPVLQRHNLEWPKELNCSKLPAYNKSVCLNPSAIDNRVPRGPDREPRAPGNQPDADTSKHRCKCRIKKSRSARKAYMKGKYDYVIHATFNRQNGIPGRYLVYSFYTHKVFKNTTNLIKANERLKLYSLDGCGCHKFKKDQDYLIMGFLNREPSEPLPEYNSKTIAVNWKKRWPSNIQKWEKRMKKEASTKPKNPETESPTSN